MVKLALIGVGRWGENWLRTILTTKHALGIQFAAVVEPDAQRRDVHGGKADAVFETVEQMLESSVDVDAAIVATPASLHVPIVLELLEAGKHVLVEKPPALSCRGLQALINAKRDLVLMVGYVYLHHPGIEYMREQVLSDIDAFGRSLYARCRWTNDGIVREDVDVLWNVAVHPLSVLLDFFGCGNSVKGTWLGGECLREGRADFGMLSFTVGDVQATVEVSWLDLRKRRDIWIRGERQAVWFDEIGRNFELYASQAPSLSLNWSFASGLSPLERQLARFVRAIEYGENCVTPIDSPVVLRVTELLESVAGSGWEVWDG